MEGVFTSVPKAADSRIDRRIFFLRTRQRLTLPSMDNSLEPCYG